MRKTNIDPLMQLVRRIVFCFCALSGLSALAQPSDVRAWKWYEVKNKKVQIHLYVFWNPSCSHCTMAVEFLKGLNKRHDWLLVTMYDTTNSANLDLYRRLAQHLNRQAGQVPAFFFCKQLEIGFNGADTSGKRLESALIRCKDALQKQVDQPKPPVAVVPMLTVGLAMGQQPDGPRPGEHDLDLPPADETVDVPYWGEVPHDQLSLPALTVVLAGMDAFNPCAFFVLMILLSLMLRSGSRARMLVVGSVFVFTSGLMYFLFMAAWLNVFFVVGYMRWVTVAAGIVATVVALINIKDYFWFKTGLSLSIPESAKPGLFQRMNALIAQGGTAPLLCGTATLACAANLYELLCTSGFPMVYTRVLTLRDLPTISYYSYLVLYNLIYVVPLAVIVAVFAWTLSAHKLTETEGRKLKLLSGMMMLGLGGVLIWKPELLNQVAGAAGLLAAAIVTTMAIIVVERAVRRPSPTLKTEHTNVLGRDEAGPAITHTETTTR